MKKKPAKPSKLQTCPGCGKGGFINLKSHVCRAVKAAAKRVDVELIAPNESLPEIEKALTPLLDRVQRKSEDLLYDMVHAGLFLMKAQESHRCATCHTGSDGKFLASEDGGFRTWLEEKYPLISTRTAYRYINGAKNCGLTVLDDASAIEKLRAAHALAGKTAGDLYRLKDKEEPEPDDEPTRWNLMRDLAIANREHCDQLLENRSGMNKRVFETVAARLHRTIEEFTGTGWVMTKAHKPGAAQPFFREHGDVYELGS